MRSALELRRFAVYGAVGTLNTAIGYALFAFLVHVAAWHHHLALVIDYALGIVLGYVLHGASTFADRACGRQTFRKYALTLLATFLANLALLDAIVRGRLLDPLAAQAVAMSVATLASYLVQSHWVFRHHEPPATPETKGDHPRPTRPSPPPRSTASSAQAT